MSKTDKLLSSRSWQASVQVVEDFLKSDSKLDALLDRASQGLPVEVGRRVQYLSYGVVRNLGRLQALLKSVVKKQPKKRLQAIMLVSLFEWVEADEGTRPLVVHHAVAQAKRLLSGPESRFVNAVLRKIPALVDIETESLTLSNRLSIRYSHPQWMIDRWLEIWGEAETEEFLNWNQKTPKVYAFCWVSDSGIPDDWLPTDWAGFYEIQNANWGVIRSMLSNGYAYIQDPSTRLGCELLESNSLKSALDLCAAPGGKSIQLLNRMDGSDGLLVSVDLPGRRFDRLQENLVRYQKPGVEQVQVAADVLHLKSSELPVAEYDAVYVDLPCSNTGVLQRRPDVKWRLNENSILDVVELQKSLLVSAARFVKREGLLISSTCSVEPEENEGLVRSFLKSSEDTFVLEKEISSLPWKTGHDGASATSLRRVK